jgi:hypothetical protein
MIEQEHARSPMFIFVYLAANHFPGTTAIGPI